jgi:hypothetical protein
VNWWNALSLFWKIVAGFIGGITLLASGLATFKSFRNWILEHHDSPVFEFLRGREKVARLTALPGLVVAEPTTVTFMAAQLHRKPQSVINSLMRLEKTDKVHQVHGGWQFGPTPQRPTAYPTAEPERWSAEQRWK